MDYMEAALLAIEAYGGALDRSGNPLINHAVAVSERVESADAKLASLLHDVLEDTSWSADDLRARGVPEEIVQAVEIVSRPDGESYEDFIARVVSAGGSEGALAREVKIADPTENIGRVHELPPDDRSRLESRYRKAFAALGVPVPEVPDPAATEPPGVVLVRGESPDASWILEASLDDEGDLVIAGQDFGRLAVDLFGDSDYEYWIRVDASLKPKLLAVLERSGGRASDAPWGKADDLRLLEELKAQGFETSSALMRWLDDNGVRYVFSSY